MEIRGTKNNDNLVGTDGFDKITGGRGSDVLDSNGGFDHLKGGKGADVFILSDPASVVTILDFQPGKDRVVIDIDGWQDTAVYYDSIGVLQAGPDLVQIAQLAVKTHVPTDDILYF